MMIKLLTLLKEALNLKTGRIYPEVELKPFDDLPRELLGDGFDIVDKKLPELGKIGAVTIKKIDGVENVVSSIFINPEFRGKSYAVPTYVKLAEELGSICSGELRENGTPTSFVSKEAKNVWDRLTQIFEVEKVPIQGEKFRYCLRKENI